MGFSLHSTAKEMKMKKQIKIYLQVVRVHFYFSSFCCDFSSSSPLCDFLYSRWQKTEADIQHTVYWFEERGNKITLWDWCLCLYMTFTAPHFISHSASLSPFCLLLPLVSIILCRSERERRGEEKKSRSAYKRGVLGQAANAGKDVSRWLWKGNGAEVSMWNPGGTFASMLHNCSLSLSGNARRILQFQCNPFNVTLAPDSSSFIDKVNSVCTVWKNAL